MQSWRLSALRKTNTTLRTDQIKSAKKIAELPRKKKTCWAAVSVNQALHRPVTKKKTSPSLLWKATWKKRGWPPGRNQTKQSVGSLLPQSSWQHWYGCVLNWFHVTRVSCTQTARAHGDMPSVSMSLFLPLYRQPALTHLIWVQHRKCLDLLFLWKLTENCRTKKREVLGPKAGILT